MRAVDNEEGKMIIEGYAITYDQPATHAYGTRKFTEIIKRGALDYFLNYVEKKNIRNYIYWKYKFDNYKEEIKEK